MTDVVQDVWAAVISFLGGDDIAKMEIWGNDSEALRSLKNKARSLFTKLYDLYQHYPSAPKYVLANTPDYIPIDKLSVQQARDLLQQAMDKQSQFSQWALNYSPISTALKAFEQQTDKLRQQVVVAQAAYDKASDEVENKELLNEQMRNDYERARDQADKVNAQAQEKYDQQRKAVDEHNERINTLQNRLQDVQDRAQELHDIPEVLTNSTAVKQAKANLRGEFNRLQDAAAAVQKQINTGV